MTKQEQIKAIKWDIEVFENAPTLYFASDSRKTQIKIVISKSKKEEIINYLKQKIKKLEEEQDND